MKAPVPTGEDARLAAVRAYAVLDTPPESDFDAITELARHVTGCPIALVTVIDADRQWTKSHQGLEVPDLPRDDAFCAHAILSTGVFTIADAREDPRFARNPLVASSPFLRFYAGVPLLSPDGHAIGTLCVLDRERRVLAESQVAALRALARQVMTLLEWRKAVVERDAAADALRHTETRYRAIVESGQGLICTHDLEGRLLSVNASGAGALGYRPEEMIGRLLTDFVPEARRERVAEYLAAVVRDGVINGRVAVITRSGNRRVLAFRNTLYRDRDGKTYVLGHAIDDTERARFEEELQEAKEAAEQANRAKGDFLAAMSHEIRTPMNAIIGMVGLLLDTPLTSHQRDYAETVRSSAESLLTILNDVLDLSKIEAGKVTLERIEFSVQGVIEDVVELLAVGGSERGVELVHRVDPRIPPRLAGDSGRLRQVIMNLVENAIKFTSDGEVSVTAEAVDRAADRVDVRIAVRDTGVGIPTDKLEAIFAKFTQADSSTTRRYGGTGLGLTIARHLVQLMGGDIGVESQVGRGSTFSFTVPFEVVTPEAVQPPRVDLSPWRVLASSAHRLRLDSLAERLQRLSGAAPVVLHAGAQGLSGPLHGESPFDVALIDCGRERRVAEIIPRLRQVPALARTHLVLLVTAGQPPVQRYQDVTIVLKPARDPQLLAALARAVGRQVDAEGGARAAAETAQPGTGFRVLLAEDNLVNQKVATHMLERIGCRVDLASDGGEAVAMVKLLPYDLVLMDCQMPGMDGYAATEAIRKLPGRASEVPVVALTAGAQAGDAERCFKAGMDDYLAKPVTFKGLTDAVKRWARRGHRAAAPPVAIDFQRLHSVVGDDPGGEALAEIVNAFLLDTPGAVAEIRRAAGAGEAGALRGSAHALKGSSSMVGAVALREVCERIEAASVSDAAGMLPELEAAADRACSELRTALGGA